MRRDWDDAPRLRSDGRQPPHRAGNDTSGMPLPPRRHVAPEARPTTYGGYEPPTAPAHPTPRPTPAQSDGQHADEHDTGRVLRRVDGTPIRETRVRPARRHAAQQPSAPPVTPTPTLDYKSVDFVIDAPVATPTYTDYSDIILELPATRTESLTRPPRERSAPLGPSAPVVNPRTMPPTSNTPHAGVPQRQLQAPARPPERAIVGRPLPKTMLPETVEHYAELTPLPPGVCPQCRGAGYLRIDVPIGHHSFGKAIPCACKETEIEQRRRDELWRLSSLDAFQDLTFEHFNSRVPGTREAWEAARRYAENPDGWLVLSGSCGSGKTHLAAAIANMQFELGTMVLFTVVPHLLDHLRAAFAPSSETTYDALFDKVCQAGLLVLDDLGAEHSTPWAQEKLFQIINHRYMYHYPTVITTNLDLINDIDDRVRSRLTDISLVRHMRVDATDYRPHHVPPRRSTRP